MSQMKVLDSYALLAFFQDEPGAGIVEKALMESDRQDRFLLMSVINWGEILYILTRRIGTRETEGYLQQISKLPIEIVPVDQELTRIAAGFKAKYSLSYADCFAAALAFKHKSELLTGDPEFKLLESTIKIRWLK